MGGIMEAWKRSMEAFVGLVRLIHSCSTGVGTLFSRLRGHASCLHRIGEGSEWSLTM